MNDTRMVPGPSNEEIGYFIGEFYTHDEWASREVDPDFTMALIRAALARWGAQTDYDAEKVEALLGNYERLLFEARDVYIGWIHKKIESVVSVEWLAEEKAKVSAVLASLRPKGRVVERWACRYPNGLLSSVMWESAGEALASGGPNCDVVHIEILDVPEEE